MSSRAARRAIGSRRRSAGFSVVEIAIGFSLLSSVAAVAIPTFLREVKSSRFVEPIEGITALGASAITYASAHAGPGTVQLAFPRTAPLTPATPPRGKLVVDPLGTWRDPTWTALGFPVVGSGFDFADGAPHAYSFAFESAAGPARSAFKAVAHGDLDGDGTLSTFELTGSDTSAAGPILDPGMYIEAELE